MSLSNLKISRISFIKRLKKPDYIGLQAFANVYLQDDKAGNIWWVGAESSLLRDYGGWSCNSIKKMFRDKNEGELIKKVSCIDRKTMRGNQFGE